MNTNNALQYYPINEMAAYITFDDEPDKYTWSILDLCKESNTKVTFFVLEPRMRENEEIVRRIVKEGHTIGLHGVSHDRIKVYASAEDFLNEMEECNNTLEKITGIRSSLVRAPYGSFPYIDKRLYHMIREKGYTLWDWNIDSTDSLKDNTSEDGIMKDIQKSVLKLKEQNINPVILFHNTCGANTALPRIICFLKESGFRIEPLIPGIKPVCFMDCTKGNSIIYTVKKGDTLWKVSRKYGITVEELKERNGIISDIIDIGQKLVVKFIKPGHKASIVISRVKSAGNKIALTYDCGFVDSKTSEILDVLNKYDVKCTFFLTGIWSEKFPALAKRIAEEGHEIANHTYSHPDMRELSYEEMIKNVIDGETVIRRITGASTRSLFREPYGAWNDGVLKAVGDAGFKYSIFWSLDTMDWKMPPAEFIAKRIIKKVRRGDIVLMHVGGDNTADASDIAIPKLKKMGYKLVTVGRLLNIK